VLGSGIDVIYPREHAALAAAIEARGAVVSELFMGVPPLPQHFPIRNRIVSGLARGTVVVEATERSGSLITARCALEQGREVFAIPGPITAARSRGTNLLLQRGAKLVTGAADVLEGIGVTVPPRAAGAGDRSGGVTAEIGAAARAIVGVLADGEADTDELVARTGLTPPEVLRMLLELELVGVVCQLPGGTYSLPPEARGPIGIAQPRAEHGA
jgi:DNA processing protein